MPNSEKNSLAKDTFLVGLGVSPGIGIGEAYLVNRSRMAAVERCVMPGEIDAEVARFFRGIDESKRQLEAVKNRVADQKLLEHLYIIDTHLLILQDQMLIDETVSLVRDERLNAEGALSRTLKKFRRVFEEIEDEYLRERASDIDSVGERLLRNLVGEIQRPLTDIDRKVVVVAHDLSPADTMQMDKEKVIGFITDVGGRTSHTAILARSLGIPAVVGLETATVLVPEGAPVIVDGSNGTVVLNPSQETFREYLERKQSFEYFEKELLSYRDLKAETEDGHRVVLKGNIELAEEVRLAQNQGAEGLGLFRTEFLYFNRPTVPSEDEQFEVYRNIVASMAPLPVTIRTLDVGGDKFVPEINLVDESNPAMGLRAIRFSLKEVRLFKAQLRAILRASAHGAVRIMFPMISGVGEVRACKKYLDEVKSELTGMGEAFDSALPVGIMVETPSSALIADLLAREVDFFSVGTNDLIQYCLAVDRGNEHVAHLFEPLHPAILRALRIICRAAREAEIPVGMCGEMAAEPLYAMVLVGMGFDELSMNAPCIPRVKRIIRQLRRDECAAIVDEILSLPTAREVAERLENEMARRFPDIFGAPLI